jgi:ribose transport system substrate-binding protein
MKMTVGAAAAFALLAASSAAEAALVLGVKGSPFYQALACGAKAKAKELGLALTISAPDQFAADSQIPVVNAIAATTPVVAAIVPTDAKALIAPMKQLADRGTKIVTIDQTIEDSSFVQTQILTDNAQGGRLAADALNALLDGKGEVLVITQPPGSAAQDARTTGFEEELKKYPGIVYLGAQYQSDDPQKAAEIVTSTLSAHPKLAGLFSTNDQGAIGALTGLRQAGALGKVKVVAYDAASAEVSALRNVAIQALIAQDPKQEGEVAMESAAKLIKGDKLDKTTLTEIVTIKAGDTATTDKYEYKGDCD